MIYTVVLNWNNAKDTIECLESLNKLKAPEGEAFKILCVDNNSQDGSFEMIQAAAPYAELLRTETNLGYAGGNNFGIKYALEHNADYVWILNNDTSADENALTGLLMPFQENKNTGASGSLIMYYDEKDTVWFAGGRYKKFSGITVHYLENQKYNASMASRVKNMKYDFLSGCSFMVKREVFEKVGFLNDKLYLLFEEIDFFCRMKKTEFSWAMSPESVVYHKISRSPISNPMRLYYFTRNMLYITKTYYPSCMPFVLFYCLKWPLLSTFIKDRKNFRYVVKAFKDAFNGKGGVYSEN